MSDGVTELYKAHRDAGEKYTYFLLAAAGAAIAFSITQTQTAIVNPPKMFLGLAVLCWGTSFFCGCRHIIQVGHMLHTNYQYLRVSAGQHPNFPPDPQFLEHIRRDLEQKSDKSGGYARAQFRFLIAGAICFIIWHVMEMWMRTPA